MNQHFSEKIKFFFALFVCLLIIFADRVITFKDISGIDSPDNALFKYRSYIKETRRHNLKQLKDILYRQLDHENIRVRMNAAEVLGELEEPDVLNQLWRIYLNENDAFVRNSAIAGMLNQRDPAVLKLLLHAMSDADPEVRRESIQGCLAFADASLKGFLETKFTEESDPLNRLALAALLYRIGDTTKLIYLKDALLQEKNPEVRVYVAHMLHVAHMLQDTGVEINAPIIKEILDKENNPAVKIWLAALLAAQGDTSALDYLKNLVSGQENPALKSSAAQALNALGEQAYVYPYLLDLLKTGDEGIRERAIEDLVDFRNYPLLPVLNQVLKNDPSITVREIAAWAMGERKEKEALPYLEQGLYDESAFVRTGVIAALYKILSVESLELNKKVIVPPGTL
ncbi:MAG: HEAT repeat domain-containing protein [Candidatus Omnitrophota bacterium]|jgi:HEAT repeat protein